MGARQGAGWIYGAGRRIGAGRSDFAPGEEGGRDLPRGNRRFREADGLAIVREPSLESGEPDGEF